MSYNVGAVCLSITAWYLSIRNKTCGTYFCYDFVTLVSCKSW